MKAFVLAILFLAEVSFAQTNATITFTNSDGVTISNAEVLSVSANKLTYSIHDGGGGSVKLADLPPELQSRFGYNIADAEEADKTEAAARAADLKARAEMTAAMEKYNRLKNRLEQGARRVNGKVLQKLDEGLLVDSGAHSIALAQEMHYGISPDGSEISHGGGTLIEGRRPGTEALSLVLLEDYPDPNMTDDGHVDVIAYPVGLFKYETVNKSAKTVRRFSCNLDAAIRELALPEQNPISN